MITTTLSTYLKSLVEDYALKNNYTLGKPFEKKSTIHYPVELERFNIEFVYNKKDKADYPISTLSCRVYLDKSNSFFFEMPEIINYIDAYDFHCYYFPYIESAERLEACFNYITDTIDYHLDEINSLANLSFKYTKMKLDEIKEVFNIDTDGISIFGSSDSERLTEIDEYVSSFITARFTKSSAYIAYLENDYETALKEYAKLKKLTAHEKKLVEFIKDRYAPYQAIDIECASILDIQEYTTKKKFQYFAITVGSCVAAFYILLFIIDIFVNIHYHRTTLFTDPFNPLLPPLWGFIPGLVLAITFEKKIEPLFRKNKKQAHDFYALLDTSTKDDNKKRIIAVAVAVFIAIIMFADYCQPTFLLYRDRVKFNTHAKPFNHYAEYMGNEYIDVLIAEGRIKKDNTYEPGEHYVILFKNDQYIDFDSLKLSKKRTEKLVKLLRGNSEIEMRRIRAPEVLE